VSRNQPKGILDENLPAPKDYVPPTTSISRQNASIVPSDPADSRAEPGTGKTVLERGSRKRSVHRSLTWPHASPPPQAQQGAVRIPTRVAPCATASSAMPGSPISPNYSSAEKIVGSLHTTEKRPVLLIDEIDKADINSKRSVARTRRMEFFVYETARTSRRKERRPIVSDHLEKTKQELPDASCASRFHYITFPTSTPEPDRRGIFGSSETAGGEALRDLFEVARKVPA